MDAQIPVNGSWYLGKDNWCVGVSEYRRMGELVKSYKELRVYQKSVELAMEIFELTKTFPAEEKFSMVDQIRRSSRSVCSNLVEAWRKRRYKAAFIAKMNDVESEAAETQIWIEFALRCNYILKEKAKYLDSEYEHVISQIIKMIEEADKWLIRTKK